MTGDSSEPDPSAPPSDDAELWWPPTFIEMIRLMGEHTVRVPLWGDRGLMYGGPEDLVSDLGVSPELASDLVAWADAWLARPGEPDHDAEAAALVRRLADETEHRYRFVYVP